MSINKSISYILCNKGIIVNLYKLHFPSFHFSLQPNKRVFHLSTFPPLQPNTQEGKTKWTLKFKLRRVLLESYIFLCTRYCIK